MLRTFYLFSFTLFAGGVAAHGAIVNVTCANSTTDAATLNTAIGNSHSGDQIQIHGICMINATIVLLGDRAYVGDSRTGTILYQASGANLPAMLASDSYNFNYTYTGDPIRVAHFTIDGKRSENTGTNGLVIRSWLTVVEDLEVENTPGDGIQLTNLSQNGTALTTSQVNGHISNCFVTGSGGIGIHVVDTGNSNTDWSLLDSWVASSGQSAIYMDNAAGWTVRGNHVYGVPQHGIYANNCYATTIDGNYIEEFGRAGGNTTWYGVACTLNGGSATAISGNKVFMYAPESPASEYVYIGVPAVNYGTGEVAVNGNVIFGAGGSKDIGLSYEVNGGQGLDLLSANNNVQNVQVPKRIGSGVTVTTGY
jgi:parallel beta-helix repeat protein